MYKTSHGCMFGGYSTWNYVFRERIDKFVGGNAYVSVNGATTYTSAGNTIFQFDGKSGSLSFSNVEGTIPLRILAVGGGGGGGAGAINGGGGGGGGVFYRDSNLTDSITARISVGDGGIGGSFSSVSVGGISGSNGGNTALSFNYQKSQIDVVAYGGGAGGNSTSAGTTGGSSGGAGYSITVSTPANTSASNNAFAGGKWVSGTGSAGGGGAGTAGLDASSGVAASGGDGYVSSITGAPLYWGGGGGGGMGSVLQVLSGVAGNGGFGGGGGGGISLAKYDSSASEVATQTLDCVSAYSPETNKIYMFPSSTASANVSIFNVDTNAISTVSVGTSRRYRSVVRAPNTGKMYAYELTGGLSTQSVMLVFNPLDNSYSTIALGTNSGSLAWENGAYVEHNQTLVYIPRLATNALVINTNTDAITFYAFGISSNSDLFIGSVYSPETKKVYGIPFMSGSVCTFDTMTNEIDLSAITHGRGANMLSWHYGILGANGKIYCFNWDAVNMLVINPVENTAVPIQTLNTGSQRILSGVVSPYNNKIYCSPFKANQNLMYVINTVNDTFRTNELNFVSSVGYSGDSTIITSNYNIYSVGTRIIRLQSLIAPTDTSVGGTSALVSGEIGGNTEVAPYFSGGRGGAGTGSGGGGGSRNYELPTYIDAGTTVGTWLYSADYPPIENLPPSFVQRSMYFSENTNNYISLGTYALSVGTYEFWYSRRGSVDSALTPSTVFLFGKRNAYSVRLDTSPAQNRILATHYPGGVETDVIAANISRTNAWFHVALTFSRGNIARLYINGIAQGTATMEEVNQNSLLTVGDTSTSMNNIQMANIRVWNVIRSAADISNNRFKILQCGDVAVSAILLFSCPLNDISVRNYAVISGGYGGSGCSIVSVPTANIKEYRYYCCEFGGSGTELRVGACPIIFTLEGCVKMSSGTGNIGIFSISTSTSSFGFYMVNSVLYFVWGDSVSINTSTNIVDNQWHHLSIKTDGINKYAYVDGVQVATTNSSVVLSSSATLAIGSITISSTTYTYIGRMYNVRLWNYFRSGFDNPFVPITRPTPNLVDSVPLNETDGSTVAYDYASTPPNSLSFSGTNYRWVLDSPSPPSLAVQSVSTNSFRIAYNALYSVSQYEITVKNSKTNEILYLNTTTDLSATIVGVSNESIIYNIYVAGISANGDRTPQSKTYTLSPIQGITITDATDTQISFKFITNQYANTYQVYTEPPTTTQTINPSAPLITGLNINTIYTIYLVASHTATGARSLPSVIPDVRTTATVHYYKMDSSDFAVSEGIVNYGVIPSMISEINWANRTIASSSWKGICWSPKLNLFCAVSNTSPYIGRSADGITWTTAGTTGSFAFEWNSIAWSPASGGAFVAVATNNKIGRSSDGIVWTAYDVSGAWSRVTWAGSPLNIFCAVSVEPPNPLLKYGFDDISGNRFANTASGTPVYDAISNLVGVFSIDTSDFKVGTGSLFFINSARIILPNYSIATNGFSVSCCFNTISNTIITNSIFELGYVNDTINYISYEPQYGATIYIDGEPIYLNIGENISINVWHHIVWVIPYASSGNVVHSIYLDGVLFTALRPSISWTQSIDSTVGPCPAGTRIDDFRVYNRVLTPAEADALYQLTPVATSTDGITWTRRPASINNWRGLSWSPDLSRFVAVADTGTSEDRVMTSNNGTSWTLRSIPTTLTNSWKSVAWSSPLALFAAVAASGTGNRVMTSSDGITWSSRVSPADNEWSAITWSPESGYGMFIAVSQSGTNNRAMISMNGIDWLIQNTSTVENNPWKDIAWSSSLKRSAAISDSGTYQVMTSDYRGASTVIYSYDSSTFVYNQTDLITTSTFARGTGFLSLDSSNRGHLQLVSFTTTAPTTGFSVSYWLKCGQDASNATLFDFATDTSGSNRISAELVAGKPRFTVFNGLLSESGPTISATLQQSIITDPNKWNHLIWNIDASGFWNGYLNGLYIGSLTDASGLPVNVSRTVNYIGRSATDLSGINTATLGMDEFRVSNAQISVAEAVPLYYGVSSNSLYDPSGLYVESTGETNATIRFLRNPAAAYYDIRTYPETTTWTTVDASSFLIPALTENTYQIYLTGYSSLGRRSNAVSVSLLPRLAALQIGTTSDISAVIQYASPATTNKCVIYTYPETTTIETTDLSAVSLTSLDASIIYTVYAYALNTDNSGISLISKVEFLPKLSYVNITFISETSVKLEYPEVAGATSYEIYTFPATTLQTTSQLSYLFTGLTAGTDYTFYIMAANTTTGQRSLAKTAKVSTFASTSYYYKMDTIDISLSSMRIANYKNTTGTGMDASGVGGDGSIFDASALVFVPNTLATPSGGITSSPFTYSAGTKETRFRNGLYDISASSVDTLDVSSVLWGAFDNNPNTYWKSLIPTTIKSITPITGMDANTYVYPIDGLTYIASASSIYQNDPTYSAFRAFDGNSGTLWHAAANIYTSSGTYGGSVSTTIQGIGSVLGEWCQMQFPYAFRMTGYILEVRNSIRNSIAKVFYIVGSNDGTTWNVVKYVERTELDAPSGTYTDNDVVSSVLYTYYRIIITNIYRNRGNTELVRWDISGITSTSTTPYSVGSTVVFDGVSNQTISGEWIQLQLPYQGKLVSYTVSAELAPVSSMPKTLYVVGSTNGTSWTSIDYMDIASSTKEIVKQSGSILHNRYYTYFRLIANKTFGSDFVSFGKWDIYVDAHISPIRNESFVQGNAALSIVNGITNGVRTGNTRIQMPPFTITAETGMAVSYWMQTDISSGTLFDFADATKQNTMSMRLSNAGIPTFYMYQGESVYSRALITPVADNSWNHFVWNIDPSGRWTSYINGLSYDLSNILYPSPSVRTQNFLGFDASSQLSTNLGIDDFRVWNKPIDDKQASLLYYGKTWVQGLDVSAVSVSSVSDTSAVIQYSSNPNATVYEIRTYPPSTSGTATTTSNTYTINGLVNNGTRYNIYVAGLTDNTRSQMKTTLIYEAPSSISVIDVSNTSATITYSPIEGISNYTVKYTNSSATEITANVAGTTYEVSDFGTIPLIVSVSASGVGFTAYTTVNVSQPSTLSVDSVDETSATISFSTVEDASYYEVETIPTTGTRTATASPFTITDLTYGSVYSGVRIRSFQVERTNIHSSAWKTLNTTISTNIGVNRYYKFDVGDINTNTISVANYNTGVIVYDASLATGASTLPTINSTDYKVGTGSLQLVRTNKQYVSLPPVSTSGELSISTWVKLQSDASNSPIFDYGSATSYTNSLYFGQNACLSSTATSSDYTIGIPRTFEFWMRSPTMAGDPYQFPILRDSAGRLFRIISNYTYFNIGGNIFLNHQYNLSQNIWYHYAVVMDSISTRVYVNGEYITQGGVISTAFVAPFLLFTNNADKSSSASTQSYVSDFRIWNIARTPLQIKNGYNRIYDSTDGLILHLPMNEGTGTTVFNAVPGKPNFIFDGSASALPSWSTIVPFTQISNNYISMKLTNGFPNIYTRGFDYVMPRSFTDNSWNHVAWTIDSLGKWSLYVNGLQEPTIINGLPSIVSRPNAYIGRFVNDTTILNTTSMLIDDYREYSYALNYNSIQRLYAGTPFSTTNVSPTNIQIADVSLNSAYLTYTANPSAESYSIQTLPETTITTTVSNELWITGLNSNTMYRFYVYGVQSGQLSMPVITNYYTPYKYAFNTHFAGSVRIFTYGYNGPVVQVRRSSDGAVSDFYTDETQSYLTTGVGGTGTSYASWIGVNIGYIRILYNQNGSSNHASNTADNATQPRLSLRNSKYIIEWVSNSNTVLTLATRFNANTIFSQFWNNNTTGTIAAHGSSSGTIADFGMRFGVGVSLTGLVINGNSNNGDWYFSCGAPKFAYVNGIPAINLFSRSAWNSFSCSVTNSVNSNGGNGFQFIGRDANGAGRSINGFMTEIIFHNGVMSAENMIHFHNNRLVTDAS